MIICNGSVLAIVPRAEIADFLLEDEPDYVEVKFWATMHEVHKTTTGWWYCGLDMFTELAKAEAIWVRPD